MMILIIDTVRELTYCIFRQVCLWVSHATGMLDPHCQSTTVDSYSTECIDTSS